MSKAQNEEMVQVTVASERAEAIGGVLIAFFAAMMSIAALINGNYEEEMMIAHNKYTTYSSWYQSKSIKQSLRENEIITLRAIQDSSSDRIVDLDDKILTLQNDILRYKKEKNEILLGSAHVPTEDWTQDIDGEMGRIVGVKEWELIAEKYDAATKKFDLAMLLFQISLVLGAVCIIIYDNPPLQRSFIFGMCLCGIIAIILSIYGYSIGQ